MIHFIRQLQYYCHLEVIGCSWQVLEEFAKKKEGDLDSLIEAHRAYLDRLVNKALLLSSKSGKEVRCVPCWARVLSRLVRI
jgi:gamma-tubulin complex component 3